MAETTTLDALQTFHRELVAIREGRAETSVFKDIEQLVAVFEREFERFWDRPPKSEASRNAVRSGASPAVYAAPLRRR